MAFVRLVAFILFLRFPVLALLVFRRELVREARKPLIEGFKRLHRPAFAVLDAVDQFTYCVGDRFQIDLRSDEPGDRGFGLMPRQA